MSLHIFQKETFNWCFPKKTGKKEAKNQNLKNRKECHECYTFFMIQNLFAFQDEDVEAMTSKIILMMPKNQELSKFQRIRLQESSLKDSRFKNSQDQDSRLKIQDSRFKRS